MSIRSFTYSSNLTDFLPTRQEFVFFTRDGRKGVRNPGSEIVHVRWSSIFEKWDGTIGKLSFGGCFTKHPVFQDSKNRKWLFGAKKKKIFSCNIVRHPKMHMCVQYGHIITNYAAILAITLVVQPERHETSNLIAHSEKVFLRYLQYSKFDIFPCNYGI